MKNIRETDFSFPIFNYIYSNISSKTLLLSEPVIIISSVNLDSGSPDQNCISSSSDNVICVINTPYACILKSLIHIIFVPYSSNNSYISKESCSLRCFFTILETSFIIDSYNCLLFFILFK